MACSGLRGRVGYLPTGVGLLCLGGHVGWTVMTSAAAELHLQRGEYLNAMALADYTLSLWFFYRLGVAAEERETFLRLVDTGTLGSRIELFKQLDNTPEHKDVARGLKEANGFRNVLAHGQVLHGEHPNSSMADLDELVIQLSRRKGIETKSVSPAEIEVKRQDLVVVINSLLQLIRALPRH